MSTNRTYIIMKNGVKIKTTKSLNTAKAFADQEQAEVFCNGENVYSAAITSNPELNPTTTDGQEDVSSPASYEKPEGQELSEEQKPAISIEEQKQPETEMFLIR